MNAICENLMGENTFCKILDPDYVFFNIVIYLIGWCILGYLFVKIKNEYIKWKNTRKKD
jgi:hypothetical protein